jgi:hypothetical protein
VDGDGGVVGIVSVDDFVELLAEELGQLAKPVAREQKVEVDLRP